MTKYRVAHYFLFEIVPIQVVRETEAFVWIYDPTAPDFPRKEGKRLAYTTIFDTFEEAKSFLIEKVQQRIDIAKKSVHVYEQTLDAVRKCENQNHEASLAETPRA